MSKHLVWIVAVSILHPGFWVRGSVLLCPKMAYRSDSPPPVTITAFNYLGAIKVVPTFMNHTACRYMGVWRHACIILVLNFAASYKKSVSFILRPLYIRCKNLRCPFNSRLIISKGSLNVLANGKIPVPADTRPLSSSCPHPTLTSYPTINPISLG
jgi:hypothetical protein